MDTMNSRLCPILLFAVAFSLLFAACDGPVGPAGRQGVAGDRGPAGTPGFKITTVTHRVEALDFQNTTATDPITGKPVYMAEYDVPLLVPYILEHGLVISLLCKDDFTRCLSADKVPWSTWHSYGKLELVYTGYASTLVRFLDLGYNTLQVKILDPRGLPN